MQRHTDPALTQLAPGALMTLPRGSGHGIAVFAGLAWVTEEDDPDDHFVAAGESLRLKGEGRVVVQALGATVLLVFDTETVSA